jgi:hypothetical protein
MDLISFEDLVVQPYNSYFNLEKELHDVKSTISLMDQRLKYLEKPAKKPAKKYKNKPAKKDTDVEDYELIAKKIQNDADRKLRLINRNGLRKKNEEEMIKRKEEWEKWDKEREEESEKVHNKIVNTVCLGGDILADNIIFEPTSLQVHLYKYNIIKEITINVSDIKIRPYNNLLRCILKIISVEKIIIYATHDYRLIELIDNIIKDNFKFTIIEIKIGYSIGRMFPLSSISTRYRIENLKSYCNKNNIVLKLC